MSRSAGLAGVLFVLAVALAPAAAAWADGESAAGQGQAQNQSKGAEQAAVPAGGEDRETLARLVDYLNRIDTLKSRFVQVSSNGAYAEGDLYLDRPGRMRFEYDPPHPALLIANGVTLLYYDRELKQATFLPLWETPLWFLIRDEIDLDDGVELKGIEQGAATIRVTLQLSDDGGEGQVTLVFGDRPLSLHSWEIEDAQGIMTQVSLVNPQFGAKVEDSLFEHGDLNIHFQDRESR
ncbi:MAG: outer membrane lipoprotein carrier protein LolA [Kiloniellales bacterium]|nr:outer membrane lipoprotein carrier protein LolA [Kiloniellales bacterium]